METYADKLRELANLLEKGASIGTFKILFRELMDICKSIGIDNMRVDKSYERR